MGSEVVDKDFLPAALASQHQELYACSTCHSLQSNYVFIIFIATADNLIL